MCFLWLWQPTAIGICWPTASALELDNHIRSHHSPLLVKGCWTEFETSPGIQVEAVGKRAIMDCQGFEEEGTQEDPAMWGRVGQHGCQELLTA